jgi:hypothetical protein
VWCSCLWLAGGPLHLRWNWCTWQGDSRLGQQWHLLCCPDTLQYRWSGSVGTRHTQGHAKSPRGGPEVNRPFPFPAATCNSAVKKLRSHCAAPQRLATS